MKIAVGTNKFLILKKEVIKLILNYGHEVVDVNDCFKLGVWELSRKVAIMVNNGDVDRGIIIDEYAQVSFVVTSKFPNNIVASLYDEYSASLTIKHNNTNIICLSALLTSVDMMKEIVKIYLNNNFEGGRHKIRVDMLKKILKN